MAYAFACTITFADTLPSRFAQRTILRGLWLKLLGGKVLSLTVQTNYDVVGVRSIVPANVGPSRFADTCLTLVGLKGVTTRGSENFSGVSGIWWVLCARDSDSWGDIWGFLGKNGNVMAGKGRRTFTRMTTVDELQNKRRVRREVFVKGVLRRNYGG